jgi:hypothetical protein
MKKKKAAVLVALILGISGLLESIPVNHATTCQASPLSEPPIYLNEGNLAQLYHGADFSEDSGDVFETATLILSSKVKAFDRLGAVKFYEIGSQMYALSYSDKARAKSAYLSYQKMPEIMFVEPDAIVGTDMDKQDTDAKDIEQKTTKQEQVLSVRENPATDTSKEESSSRDVLQDDKRKKVAIIDTGVDVQNTKIAPYLAVSTEDVEDQNGHGTQLAGFIVETLLENKITSDQVLLYPVKVADETGKCTILQLYLGIRQAMDHGADILNISMGTKNIAESKLLETAIKEAYEKNIIVVTSAGNDKEDIAGSVPANLEQVIAVGAMNPQKVKSDFSNYGKTLDCVSYGEKLVTTDLKRQTTTVKGTSYAAALVTAELAVKMATGIIQGPDDAMTYIKSSAEDLGTSGWDEDYGYGLIGSYTYTHLEQETQQEDEKEKETNTEPDTEKKDSSEPQVVEDTTKPITNYADSGNLTQAQKTEMEACLSYGDIINDINAIAETQNVYAATGLVSTVKAKAVQLRDAIQGGSITARYFDGYGYVSPVAYQKIGIDAVDVAGKEVEDALHTYAKTGSEADWKAFCGKVDAFYHVLNANRKLELNAESQELSNLTLGAASSAKKRVDKQGTQGRMKESVSIESCDVGFADTDIMLRFQNIASEELYQALNTYDTDHLKKFVNALSDNDKQLLAARLGVHYQDIMARVYDAEVQTESLEHKTYYVADEASMRMYSSNPLNSQQDNTALINKVLQPSNLSATIELTKSITANNYYCVYGEVTITSKNSSQYKMSSNFDNKNQEFVYDANHNAIFNNTLSMIYVYAGGTLHLNDSAVLNGNGQKHNGFLVFVNPGATFNIRDNVTLKGNIFTGYSNQRNGGYGGAVHNQGTVNMSGGTISGNSNIYLDGKDTLTAGGAAIGNQGGVVNISGGMIRNNSAHYGAVWNSLGILNITGGTLEQNTSAIGSAQGGNIHASKENPNDNTVVNTVNIKGGVIRDSLAGNGMYIGKGCICDITGEAYFYGNAESGIGNDGTMMISGKTKIGFVTYKNLSEYSISPNKARGITNNLSGKLTISSAFRVFGANQPALVNDGSCSIKSSSDAIFLCTTSDNVIYNTAKLNVAGYDSSGGVSLSIYSSSSRFGINNGGPAKTGTMLFGGKIDGRYNVTDTGRQGASSAQYSFTDSCIYTNGTGYYDTSHPYALQIYGNAVIQNGATGINVADGKCYLASGNVAGNTTTGINNSATIEIKGGTIYSNNRGINNKVSGNVTMTGGSITGNVATESGAGINNLGTFNLTGGTVSGNNAGTYGGGVMNKAGAVFALNGGSILNNAAGTGGGIFNYGTVNMTGGSISGNTNHGIYQSGTFNMSGVAAVDTNNDVCLPYDSSSGRNYVIRVTSALSTNGIVANITPMKSGSKVSEYKIGTVVVSTIYSNSKGSNALYYNMSNARFALSNGGILRPGDYMDDGVIASGLAKGTISSTIADTDIAISTRYNITYNKNLDNVLVSIPANQSKYWCEDVKLIMGTPVITDATKAAQFEFRHWNDDAGDKGTTYTNGQMYTGNSNITIHAQWQNNINIAYIGNEQQKGNDYVDQNVSQSKDYTFGSNQDASGGKHFDKTAIKTYTDAETGKEVEQEVGCTVVGWRLGNAMQIDAYKLGEMKKGINIYSAAEGIKGALTYGHPNTDYASHDQLLSQLNNIQAMSQNTFENALSLNTKNEFHDSGIFGASPLDGSIGAPYINLYAVWDEGPLVEAYDLYYDLAFAKSTTDTTGITMEELLSQAKTVDMEDGTLAHGKDVPIGNGKMTSFIVKNYAPTNFSSFTTNGTVSVCYQAMDSVGNVTEKTILVHIVDTTARDINAGSVRFIDGKYLEQTPENGGFADDSVWKADKQYHDLLASVLSNSKTDIQTAENSFFGKIVSIQKPGSGTWKIPPQETWSFTHEQVLATQDYVKQNGIGNSKSNNALKGFLNQFIGCRQ